MPFPMSFSSYGRRRWVVTRAGRHHVVDLDWPGFSNWIAVDGAVVESWSWPGNNLYTTRRFTLDGVPATVIRQRSGLLSFTVTIVVQDPAALVEEISLDSQGAPGCPGGAILRRPVVPPSRGGRIAAWAVPLLAMVLVLGVPVGLLLVRWFMPKRQDEIIGVLVPASILLAPTLLVVTTVVILVIVLRSRRS